jgi:superoxide reductase
MASENDMGTTASAPKIDEALKAEILAVEGKGVHTAAAPGEFAGKEGKHVPKIEVKDSKATVTVGHGMEEAHWIQYIWAKDEGGSMIGAVKLAHTDTPTLTLDVPAGVKSVTAFESCNLHGVWKADPAPVA